MTTAELLEQLKPIDPDKLQHTGDGIYEAQWSPHNTDRDSDLEVLGITPAVRIIGTVYEPEDLPGWRAVRFSYTPPNDETSNVVASNVMSLEERYTLPPLPTSASQYGEQIELVKLTIHELNRQLSQAKEMVTIRKEAITREAADNPANTNDAKRKAAAAQQLATDEVYQQFSQIILWLNDLIVLWDARRSRLYRDFEVARIHELYNHLERASSDDYQRRLQANADTYHKAKQAADYAANRARQST
jgi:hypothetical protein